MALHRTTRNTKVAKEEAGELESIIVNVCVWVGIMRSFQKDSKWISLYKEKSLFVERRESRANGNSIFIPFALDSSLLYSFDASELFISHRTDARLFAVVPRIRYAILISQSSSSGDASKGIKDRDIA
jgi:hypothetical protein